MKKSDVLQHFKQGKVLAEKLGISEAAVSQWGEDVPPVRQYQIEVITKGALKASQPPK